MDDTRDTMRASLVDRLIDDDPKRASEPVPKRALSAQAYREAVARDVEWLLNTRTFLPADRFEIEELTVIEYGAPDFGTMYPASHEGRERYARLIRKAVIAFEPRLAEVRVVVEPDPIDDKRFFLRIEGELIMGRRREPVAFPVVYDPTDRTFTAHA